MLLVSLGLQRTFIRAIDQLRARGVEDVPSGIVDLEGQVLEFLATSGGLTLQQFEVPQFLDLVQQPSRRGVELVVGRAHAIKYSPWT
jgi:hypothetical protein